MNCQNAECGLPLAEGAQFCEACGADAPVVSAASAGRTQMGTLAQVASPASVTAGGISEGALVAERFQVMMRLGQGGMGEVFLAFDRETRQQVALKTVLAGSGQQPAVLDALKLEVGAARALPAHPNLLRVLDLDFRHQPPFFTMEYAAKGDLEELWLKRGRKLPPDEVRKLLSQLFSALGALHEAGVVHQDVKPQNVLLMADGTPKLTDFGISSSLKAQLEGGKGSGAGTPRYMAPEQLRGELCDPSVDLYACGIMAVQLLTGAFPVKGAGADDVRALQLPAPFDALVPRLVAVRPSERVGTARAALALLEAGAAVSPPAASVAQLPTPPARENPSPPAPSTTAAPAGGTQKAVLAVMSGLLLIVAVGALTHQGGPPTEKPVAREAPPPAAPSPAPVPVPAPPPAVAPPAAAEPTAVPLSQRPPSEWVLSRSELFPGGSPVPALRPLVQQLALPSDETGESVSQAELEALLDDPRSSKVYVDELLKLATPRSKAIQKAEHKSFIDIFMKEKRLQDGVAFLSEHAAELQKAEEASGVTPQDIVSVLMWESNLGKDTGSYLVFNVYLQQLVYLDAAVRATASPLPVADAEAAPAHEKRIDRLKTKAAEYLVALLRTAKAKRQDVLSVRGSWAGAIGFPQFMPTSFKFAVDGDGDGAIDLFQFPDAIASIGAYLDSFGYRASRSKAIYEYNHEEEYVRGVMLYADAVAVRAAAAAAASGDGAARRGPGFDCGKARTPSEIAVCLDDTLSELDADMAESFERVVAVQPAERQAQKAWLKGLAACDGERGCLEGALRRRLLQLRTLEAAAGGEP